jgi:hypothetical protein
LHILEDELASSVQACDTEQVIVYVLLKHKKLYQIDGVLPKIIDDALKFGMNLWNLTK